MAANASLNVLGCMPEYLNILFELAQDAKKINSFNILKNIPVNIEDYFVCNKEWKIKVHNCYENGFNFDPKENYALGVVGIKSKELVFKAFKQLIQMKNKQFINLIHPSSYVSRSVILNYGLQIGPLCTLSACTELGFAVNIKRNTNIGHHCKISNFVTINPGVTISGFVKVGRNTMIGAGSAIKENVTIGSNTIIGLGSVVVKDIPKDSIAYGNPCKVFKINF